MNSGGELKSVLLYEPLKHLSPHFQSTLEVNTSNSSQLRVSSLKICPSPLERYLLTLITAVVYATILNRSRLPCYRSVRASSTTILRRRRPHGSILVYMDDATTRLRDCHSRCCTGAVASSQRHPASVRTPDTFP